MNPSDKDIERLIVRRLDGALTPDEELELDRQIIRDPQVRRLLEEYQRIDEWAAAALDAALVDRTAAVGHHRSRQVDFTAARTRFVR